MTEQAFDIPLQSPKCRGTKKEEDGKVSVLNYLISDGNRKFSFKSQKHIVKKDDKIDMTHETNRPNRTH